MFKLVKILVGLIGLGAFVWWGLTVPIGDRTLFQHVTAIAGSKESQELVRGTKEKVADLKKRVAGGDDSKADASKGRGTGKGKGTPGKTAEPDEAARGEDHLTDADRHDMRKLIDSAHRKVARTN